MQASLDLLGNPLFAVFHPSKPVNKQADPEFEAVESPGGGMICTQGDCDTANWLKALFIPSPSRQDE